MSDGRSISRNTRSQKQSVRYGANKIDARKILTAVISGSSQVKTRYEPIEGHEYG